MRHFKSVGDLIGWLDDAARMHEQASEPAKVRGISERSRQAMIANQKGYAAGFRTVVHVLRDTYIGVDAKSAKPIEECR